MFYLTSDVKQISRDHLPSTLYAFRQETILITLSHLQEGIPIAAHIGEGGPGYGNRYGSYHNRYHDRYGSTTAATTTTMAATTATYMATTTAATNSNSYGNNAGGQTAN